MFKFLKVFLFLSTGAVTTLLLLDYNGFGVVELLRKSCCRLVCCVVREIKASKLVELDYLLLLREGAFMVVIMMIIRALTRVRGKDKIDKLLENSEAVKQADYFLDKWRKRTANDQLKNSSFLVDELVEVPILHMAFVEVEKNQFERGDAADTIFMSDTTVLSVSSLFDDQLSTFSDEKDNMNFDERRLWDVGEGKFGEL